MQYTPLFSGALSNTRLNELYTAFDVTRSNDKDDGLHQLLTGYAEEEKIKTLPKIGINDILDIKE